MKKKEIDLTNKVVLDLDKYIELREELTKLRMAYTTRDDKYYDLLKYLISECEVKTYTSGKKYLEYEKYNNHLADYIKELEPELYQQKLEEDSDNKDE